MAIAPRTAYRAAVRREVGQMLEVASPFDGVAYVTPIATRAELVMVTSEVEPTVPLPAVFDYVGAIVSDAPANELEELVIATGSIPLMQRFRRYMPACHRARVREMIAVAQVMTT
jgi:hypothetical protein